jgi:hypothetical protein
MRPSKSTRYKVATISLGVIFCLALVYLWDVFTQPHISSEIPKLVEEGVLLFFISSLAIVAHAYYRKDRFSTETESEKASELRAWGALGSDRLKKITFDLPVTIKEYAGLKKTGKLQLMPARFNRPIRYGDTVRISAVNTDEAPISTTVQLIDGYNLSVTLQRKDT